MQTNDYRPILLREYERRRAVNMLFSLNAYARYIGLAPSHLNDVLAGRKGISSARAKQIVKRLNLGEIEGQRLMQMIESRHSRSLHVRQRAMKILQESQNTRQTHLQKDAFELVANWYHFAILELSRTKDFQSDAEWIAERLGISQVQVVTAIACLKRLKLLRQFKGKLKPAKGLVLSPEDIPSDAIKLHHVQVMERAKIALYDQPLDDREYFSTMMAIDKRKLKEAKELIRNFHHRLNKLLTEDPRQRSDAYCFSCQLFSLQKV